MKNLLAIVLVLIICAGCAQNQKEDESVTVWHWMTDRDKVFQSLVQQYKQETGIEVKMELFAPSNAYTQRVIASAQSKTLPDIYGVLDKKSVFASFIKNRYVSELTVDFASDNQSWEKSLFEKAVDANRFKEGNIHDIKQGIYGVPIDVTNIQMLYNKKLLDKAGVKAVPKTFDDFLAAVEALKRVGIPALVSGWGEIWMVDCFASSYAFNIMGEGKVMATYRGDVPYTDPDWVKVFSVFKRLSDAGAFVPGIVTKPNKEAEQDFALERAAFAFNGSWAVNVYHDMNPKLEYGVMLPPAIENELPMMIWGGAGSSFVVNNNSSKKDKAVAFLKWLSAKEQQAVLSKETNNLPANKQALDSISEVLSGFASVMDNTTHPTIWKYNENPVVSEQFLKGIQSIIIGEKTPEAVAAEVQVVKARELEKEKRRNKK